MEQALKEIEKLKARAANITVEGGRAYNPGWHTALDLKSMLLVSEAVGKAALERKESRGGHTRDDYPEDRSRVGQGQPDRHREERQGRDRRASRCRRCPPISPSCSRSRKK